jgi:hypothetical protein
MKVVILLLRLGGCILLLVVAGTWTCAYKLYQHEKDFARTATRAVATVIRLDERKDGDSGPMYYPIYQFQDANGAPHEVHSSTGTFPHAHAVGAKVTLLYNVSDPDGAREDSFADLYIFPLILVIVGSVTLIFAAGMFIGVFFIARSERQAAVAQMA